MPWFIKAESFTEQTLQMSHNERQVYIKQHQMWVQKLKDSGINISSGFLVDAQRIPGGGGLLLFKADCFETAKNLVEKDPMIIAGLVEWTLHEWIPITGKIPK